MRRPAATKSVSVTDVARHARVSLGTVSRVINRHPAVTADLRRRVLQSSRELGFVPRVPTHAVAVVTGRYSPALPVGYVSILTALVARLLAAQRVVAELIDIESLDLAMDTHIDGVIGIVFDERLAALAGLPNLPVATINKPMAAQGIHSFYADHYAQGWQATQHLLARGHRAIAFLAIERHEWGSRERLRGYTAALHAAGLAVDPALVQYTSEAPLYDILARWKAQQVSALLNFSEDAGLETLHILTQVLGLRIGVEISTISLEDLPIYQHLNPPQTAVRQPLEELAQQAVACVLTPPVAGAPTSVADVCLPTALIVRDSVATLTR